MKPRADRDFDRERGTNARVTRGAWIEGAGDRGHADRPVDPDEQPGAPTSPPRSASVAVVARVTEPSREAARGLAAGAGSGLDAAGRRNRAELDGRGGGRGVGRARQCAACFAPGRSATVGRSPVVVATGHPRQHSRRVRSPRVIAAVAGHAGPGGRSPHAVLRQGVPRHRRRPYRPRDRPAPGRRRHSASSTAIATPAAMPRASTARRPASCTPTSRASPIVSSRAAHWGKRLDGAVNNAAIADPHGWAIERLGPAAWRRTLDVNLTGSFLVVKHAVRHPRARGAIVNPASTRALQSSRTPRPTRPRRAIAPATHRRSPPRSNPPHHSGWIGSTQAPRDQARRAAGRAPTITASIRWAAPPTTSPGCARGCPTRPASSPPEPDRRRDDAQDDLRLRPGTALRATARQGRGVKRGLPVFLAARTPPAGRFPPGASSVTARQRSSGCRATCR